MRILYHHRIRGIDGQAVHVRALVQALVAEGHEVREVALEPVLTTRSWAEGNGASAPTEAGPRERPWRGIDRLPRPLLELAEDAYSLVGWRMVARAVTRFRPDFVYERHAFGNAGGVHAANRLGVPVVLEVNSPLVDELAGTRGVSFPALARRLEAFVLRRADLVVVVSEELRKFALSRGARDGRVVAIPNAVDAEAFRPLDEELRGDARRRLGLLSNGSGPGLVLGFTGFVREWHRLDLVLSCLARPELSSARLVVVGEGPRSPWIARRAAELGVADRVLQVGDRRHEEMPALVAAFDVALLPGAPAYASPLKLYEYLAAGLPVVAPDQENLREVLRDRDNASLFAPGDADALASALIELKDDAALRARLGARARATVLDERRTWRGVARRVVDEVKALPAP
ncbi:MAG: glycosyltransferase family 4 protein [Thermoanaerobaculia bacterium]|nr:glycosyltransferase family 4 protein [Thermoanaerobaculia bacterium]